VAEESDSPGQCPLGLAAGYTDIDQPARIVADGVDTGTRTRDCAAKRREIGETMGWPSLSCCSSESIAGPYPYSAGSANAGEPHSESVVVT
jgi:hypothetical protein